MGAGEQDVGRLHVPVQHPDVVGVLQRVAHFRRDPQRVVQRQRPLAGETILQRLALHVLHHVKKDVVRLVGLEQRHDVWM